MAKKAVIILPSAVLQLKTDGALMMVVFVKNLRSSVFSQSSKSESKLKVRGEKHAGSSGAVVASLPCPPFGEDEG